MMQGHRRSLMIPTLKITKMVYTNDHGASVISDVGTQCYVEYEDKAVNTDGQMKLLPW